MAAGETRKGYYQSGGAGVIIPILSDLADSRPPVE